MEEITLIAFLNLIEDEGCLPSHRIEEDGIIIQYYLSWDKSTKVAINVTEESMTARTAANLLRRLGIEDIIERLNLSLND